MLAADKLQLQSQLRQQAVSLKEKEFNLHHSNLMTVGTQAAVLAGLDITMFIEFHPLPFEEWGHDDDDSFYKMMIPRILCFVYYTMISAAFCSNMMVVSQTTALSVLGAGLALRGPDGSMMVATDALYHEREKVFSIFGRGLALTVSSVWVGVWLMLNWETALVCCCVALYTCRAIYSNYTRVASILDFDERDTVDFRDIMDGPANVRLANYRKGSNNNTGTSQRSRQQHQQHRGGASYSISGGGSNPDNDNDSDETYSSGYLDDDVELQTRQKLKSSHRSNGYASSSSYSRRRGAKGLESSIQTV
jgi:hypothetical protein